MRDYVILVKQSATRGHGPRSSSSEDDVTIEVASLEAADAARAQLDPEVAGIAPVVPITLVRPFDGNSLTSTSWGVTAIGASDCQFSGAGVPIAILDTGVDGSHAAFQDINVVARDFTGEGLIDYNGHGTHCAGTAVGGDVDGVRIGVARGVTKLLAGKILDNAGNGSSAAIFDAILWAVSNGARVVSMSLGLDFPGFVSRLVDDGWPTDVATSAALQGYRDNLRMIDAVLSVVNAREALDGGAVIVAAAGNESRRNVGKEYSIAASLPAAGAGVISVGAVKVAGKPGHQVADFSNSHPTLVAPGVDILSAQSGGGLSSLSGTSMACPHVAGVAALWWEAARERGDQTGAAAVARSLRGTASASSLMESFELRGNGLVRVPS